MKVKVKAKKNSVGMDGWSGGSGGGSGDGENIVVVYKCINV